MNQARREFTKEYSPWAREALARKLREAPKAKRAGLLAESERGWGKKQADFEASIALGTRDIKTHKEHLFVHTIPLIATGRANTTKNNEVVDTASLSPKELVAGALTGVSLSCSAVARNQGPWRPEHQYFLEDEEGYQSRYGGGRRLRDEGKTLYPFGIVLSEGTILSAYRNDSGTLAEAGRAHRKSKYDTRTKESAIQDGIADSLEHALDPLPRLSKFQESGGQRMGRDLNELVISDSKPGSFFINLDDPWFDPDEPANSKKSGESLLAEIETLTGEFPSIPITAQLDGKTQLLSRGPRGLETAEGSPIQEILTSRREMAMAPDRRIVLRAKEAPFEDLEAHMWARGDMPREREEEYLKDNLRSKESREGFCQRLLKTDTSGKTALEAAALSGRTRHLPKKFLNAQGIKEKERNLEEVAIEEAERRGTTLRLLTGGPKEIQDPSGNRIWAVGQTPEGGVLCTDRRGSSHACGMEWHLGTGMLRYLAVEAEKKGDLGALDDLAKLAEALPAPTKEFGPEFVATRQAQLSPEKQEADGFQDFERLWAQTGIDPMAIDDISSVEAGGKDPQAEIIARVAKQISETVGRKKTLQPWEILEGMANQTDKIHNEVCLRIMADAIISLIPEGAQTLRKNIDDAIGKTATLLAVSGEGFPHPHLTGIRDTKWGKDGGPIDQLISAPEKLFRETLLDNLDDRDSKDLYGLLEIFVSVGQKIGKTMRDLCDLLAKAAEKLFGPKVGAKVEKAIEGELELLKGLARKVPEHAGKLTFLAAVASIPLSGLSGEVCVLAGMGAAISPFLKEALDWKKTKAGKIRATEEPLAMA
jgi:hypothetical protein